MWQGAEVDDSLSGIDIDGGSDVGTVRGVTPPIAQRHILILAAFAVNESKLTLIEVRYLDQACRAPSRRL